MRAHVVCIAVHPFPPHISPLLQQILPTHSTLPLLFILPGHHFKGFSPLSYSLIILCLSNPENVFWVGDETKVHSSVPKPTHRLRTWPCAWVLRLVRALLEASGSGRCVLARCQLWCRGLADSARLHRARVAASFPILPAVCLAEDAGYVEGSGPLCQWYSSHHSQPQACAKLGGLTSKKAFQRAL